MRLLATVFFMFFSLSLFAGEINNQTPEGLYYQPGRQAA